MAAAVESDKVQTKGIQGFIKANQEKAQGFVQEFRGKLEKGVADVKKAAADNLDKAKAYFAKLATNNKGSFDKARAAAEKAVGDSVKITEETIAKLGLAKIADVAALKEAFEGLTKKLDVLKKKVDGLGKGGAAEAAQPAPKE